MTNTMLVLHVLFILMQSMGSQIAFSIKVVWQGYLSFPYHVVIMILNGKRPLLLIEANSIFGPIGFCYKNTVQYYIFFFQNCVVWSEYAVSLKYCYSKRVLCMCCRTVNGF